MPVSLPKLTDTAMLIPTLLLLLLYTEMLIPTLLSALVGAALAAS